jgi:hypothetical protein
MILWEKEFLPEPHLQHLSEARSEKPGRTGHPSQSGRPKIVKMRLLSMDGACFILHIYPWNAT